MRVLLGAVSSPECVIIIVFSEPTSGLKITRDEE